MSTVSDLQAIRARFNEAWDSTIQTVFDNAPEEQIDFTRPFVRFGVNPNQTERETFGTEGVHSRNGIIWLQILVPKAEGAKMAYDLADSFTGVFRNWRAAGMDLACGVEDMRQVPNNEHFQVNVMVPYQSRS